MISIFAVTVISCIDMMKIANNLSRVIGLTYNQKIELMQTLKSYVPSCPIILEKNEGFNSGR